MAEFKLMFREVSNFAWVLTGIPASAATFQRDTGFRVALFIGGSDPFISPKESSAALTPQLSQGVAEMLTEAEPESGVTSLSVAVTVMV